MNATDVRDTQRAQFLSTAYGIVRAAGFITEEGLFRKFTRINLLKQLPSEELANILEMTGISSETAKRLAKRDAKFWDALIEESQLSPGAIFASYGVGRLVKVVAPEELWLFIESGLTKAVSDGRNDTHAKGSIKNLLEGALRLKILTKGTILKACRSFFLPDEAVAMLDHLLGLIQDDTPPSLENFWSVCDPFDRIALDGLLEIINNEVAKPLGLLRSSNSSPPSRRTADPGLIEISPAEVTMKASEPAPAPAQMSEPEPEPAPVTTASPSASDGAPVVDASSEDDLDAVLSERLGIEAAASAPASLEKPPITKAGLAPPPETAAEIITADMSRASTSEGVTGADGNSAPKAVGANL